MDGSANNRAFLKMHFPSGNPLASKMVARCYKNPTQKNRISDGPLSPY